MARVQSDAGDAETGILLRRHPPLSNFSHTKHPLFQEVGDRVFFITSDHRGGECFYLITGIGDCVGFVRDLKHGYVIQGVPENH